ncbi:hypothetical protein WMY93_009526 [Mugilogobius chulae]|uniref:Uncharacterized protein n=1 Tax=Mugilogobius chulae TaxID=88201 RepID=A0AAW0PBT0_9GOBI
MPKPDPVRSQKLSRVGPGQYLDGRPRRNLRIPRKWRVKIRGRGYMILAATSHVMSPGVHLDLTVSVSRVHLTWTDCDVFSRVHLDLIVMCLQSSPGPDCECSQSSPGPDCDVPVHLDLSDVQFTWSVIFSRVHLDLTVMCLQSSPGPDCDVSPEFTWT